MNTSQGQNATDIIKPPRLLPGSLVRIVFPASPVRSEFFDKGLAALRNLGLRTSYGEPYRKWRYMAGTDAERRAELLEALRDPQAAAIFFARGGYGSGRILNDRAAFAAGFSPRILLGCSDITSLHCYFQETHRWVVFHGPMPSGDFARGQVHAESLRLAMMQADPYSLRPEGIEVLVPGEAEGALKGGCLTLLDATLGTPWEPDWSDSILFLEDVAIKPFQIDRMLTHLKLIGKFDAIRAFVFGEMKGCIQVENQGYTLQEVLLDILGPLGKPIYFNFPSGHVAGLNWTLPLGVRARVSADPSFRLDILDGAVV